MTIREGRWICKFCGAENLGRHERCEGEGSAGCGAARQPETRFYLPENSPVVTDEALLADAASGVDWSCDHCGGANKGARDGHRIVSCVHCGNSRDVSDVEEKTRDFSVGQVPRTERDTEQNAAKSVPQTFSAYETQKRVSSARFVLFGLIFIVSFAALLVSLFKTTEVSVPVASTSWSRTVFVDEYRTLLREGWDAPADAHILRSERKVRSHSQVLSHYETVQETRTRSVFDGTESYACGTRDLGNGYFEDRTCERTKYRTETYQENVEKPVYVPVPNYDDWEVYEVDRWVEARHVQTTGTDTSPEWAVPVLSANERKGRETATYSVTFLLEDKTFTEPVKETEWSRIRKSGSIVVKQNFWGAIRSVASR